MNFGSMYKLKKLSFAAALGITASLGATQVQALSLVDRLAGLANPLAGNSKTVKQETGASSNLVSTTVGKGRNRSVKYRCVQPYGTIRIVEGEENSSWSQMGLSAPTRILRVGVNDSRCFTVVDRGVAFSAAQRERELAMEGQFQAGQNIGAGQMKAADYVLIPDIVTQNDNAGGRDSSLSASTERFGVSRNRSSAKRTSEVVLTVVDVRTSEQVASVHETFMVADKDMQAAMGFSGSSLRAGASGGSWENTEFGKQIRMAYEKAFVKLVKELDGRGLLERRANAPTSQPLASAPYNPAQQSGAPAPTLAPMAVSSLQTTTTTVQPANGIAPTQPGNTANLAALASKGSLEITRKTRLLSQPSGQVNVVAEVTPGTIVYPTGRSQGHLLQVEDDMGNLGWISGSAVK